MIAFKLAGWVQEVIWTFMGFFRIYVETCLGFHGVLPNRRRDLFWAFMGVGRIGAGIAAWFHGMLAMARRDPWGRVQKKPDTGSRRRSADIRLGGWGIELSYGFR